jgi:hypothetical protein
MSATVGILMSWVLCGWIHRQAIHQYKLQTEAKVNHGRLGQRHMATPFMAFRKAFSCAIIMQLVCVGLRVSTMAHGTTRAGVGWTSLEKVVVWSTFWTWVGTVTTVILIPLVRTPTCLPMQFYHLHRAARILWKFQPGSALGMQRNRRVTWTTPNSELSQFQCKHSFSETSPNNNFETELADSRNSVHSIVESES